MHVVEVHVVEPLIAIQWQFDSKCTYPHNGSNSIVSDSPSVCDNEDCGETRRATDLKIRTQAYILYPHFGY